MLSLSVVNGEPHSNELSVCTNTTNTTNTRHHSSDTTNTTTTTTTHHTHKSHHNQKLNTLLEHLSTIPSPQHLLTHHNHGCQSTQPARPSDLRPNQPQFLNLLTFGLWGKLGKLTHYAFDAVLSMSALPALAKPS